MRRLVYALGSLWFVLTAANGCTSNRPTNVDVELSEIDSIAALFEFSGQRFCQSLFECAIPSDDLRGLVIAFETQARCRDTYRKSRIGSSNAGFPRALLQLETEGRVYVDVDAVQRCFENDDVCSSAGAGFGTCREIIEGVVELGADCNVTEECAGEAYCDFGANTCPGVCTARAAPGEPCDTSDACAGPGVAFCDFGANSGGHCAVREPVVIAKRGETCTPTRLNPLPCESGTFCDVPKDADSGTCVPPFALGASCDDDDDVCENGALCHGPIGSMTCQRPQRLAEGDPCEYSANEPLRYCDPFEGLTCGMNGCERIGDGSLGSHCGVNDFDELVPCNDGLYCNSDTRTCEARHAAGASCERNAECSSDSCDSKTDTCRAHYCSR